jgi:hypothetical protein
VVSLQKDTLSGAPDYATPVIGWRVLLVVKREGGWRLRSVTYPQHLVAATGIRGGGRGPRVCREHHPVPAEPCGCGVHAAHTPGLAVLYLEQGRGARIVVTGVVGRVALWGAVVDCEWGWRAEIAHPAHLYVPVGWSPRLTPTGATSLARALGGYGVPVEVIDGRTETEVLRRQPEAEAAGPAQAPRGKGPRAGRSCAPSCTGAWSGASATGPPRREAPADRHRPLTRAGARRAVSQRARRCRASSDPSRGDAHR